MATPSTGCACPLRISRQLPDAATDACAERVIRAGIDDVAFIDVTNDASRHADVIHRRLAD